MLTRINTLQGTTVAVNSQAAIRATHKGHSNGVHLTIFTGIDNILTSLYEAHDSLALTIRWAPGHVGIECNEEADKEAKRVASGGGSLLSKLPTILRKDLQ